MFKAVFKFSILLQLFFTRITALLTELYRFNPKLAPTRISGSRRMEQIKNMATSRGSFSMPRRKVFQTLININPKPLNSICQRRTEITSQIFGRSHFEFPLRLLPERAFETLTAPHRYRHFMWMHAYRHNSSAGFCGRSFPGSGNNNRDDRAPPVSRALPRKLS